MKHTTTFAVLMAIALGAGASSARAAPLSRYGVFVFGTTCTNPESDDTGGSRLTVMRTGDGDYALYQWSEGPEVAAEGLDVLIDSSGSHISFSVLLPGAPAETRYTQSFTGLISTEAVTLSGGYSPVGKPFTLPRVTDLAAPKPICQPLSGDQK
ncbi:MAG TPA: hypothetical protein VFW28_00480 [Micropepsaceae bacterium]|nr:hypothetical protein [Micropepsaceae bacterium]